MSSKTASIRRQFNRSAAGSYDNHAQVQRTMADRLAKSLIEWKSECTTVEPHILEVGCGTGTLTEILVNQWPRAPVTALDLAPAMITIAEQRIRSGTGNHAEYSKSRSDRIRFLLADVETWAAGAQSSSLDLIVSNACFQWLTDPLQTLVHLRRMLRTGGMLVFSTFGPDTFYELHQSFHEAYRANDLEPQRHGLSFQSTAEWIQMLQKAGFSSIQDERSLQTETYASARDFLHSVKAMGASSSEAAARPGLSSRRLFANMYKAYENKFSLPGGVAASYDILMIQALAEK
ncbi:malonyl-ACP O-methyltransferase BioC [Paenibacillus mendelii]|uniref:Malonyl-[acyl-carrier protein] O-methyltransferase n=1 Tax=Paenibacillus mendelii TaxID=206163 RepID=A0ABV6JG92_9BACL|nr:malonyl-ACP O-methyltransferase BioC [Paenibacillus mendelii]MCQ6557328.1 malonyl-ACP O-methyltransferase BioC [Paenibacillus mendelii]